jgi:Na+/H+ antiporter NhaC
MIVTWLMGLVIFFDDYANCLLVGNTMRPLTDRVRISREKLSFLVDGTAAPVACIAIISTWIGVELTMLVSSGVVATPDEAFAVFIATIPYRFYSVLMLLFVFAIAFTQRDFGPMLHAEQRAIATGQVLREGAQPLVDRELTEMKVPEGKKLLWHNAVVPLAGMMLIVVLGLYLSGRSALGGKAQGAGLREIFGAADSLPVLIWASFGGGLLAVGMSVCTRAIRLSEAIDAWVVGCKSMVIAVIILVLAWTIGDMCRTHLQTGPWIISLVRPPANLMPLIFFVVSCLIAFSTGTSFGTMAIVFPIAGPMLLAVTAGSDPGLARAITLATLSSVMSGAIFGDHCSPISDTTIMSSMASAADHVDHVRTQLPYALICAGVAALVGYIPAGFGVSPWISLLAGTGILVGILFVLGKRADATCAELTGSVPDRKR